MFYMNEKSREIVRLVDKWNSAQRRVAYSFDAGPNAFLFVLDEHLPALLRLVYDTYFASSVSSYDQFVRNFIIDRDTGQAKHQEFESSCIKYIIHSKVGGPPVDLSSADEHALLDKLGAPIN